MTHAMSADWIHDMAKAAGVSISPAHEAGVRDNFALLQNMAAQVSAHWPASMPACARMPVAWAGFQLVKPTHGPSAVEIAQRVRDGDITAEQVVGEALAAIERDNLALNAFTRVTRERALREARAVDARRRRGESLGPLAGVPFAAKNLFDIAGEVTLAGSKINRDHTPAGADAEAVARLCAADAVLLGALNMDEYAYGFLTLNTHDGPTRNPHDPSRSAGGSSGGSGAAVAAGIVPIALGTDTNGSVRVPASFCGIHGLRPTLGGLSLRGAFPFVPSLDCAGVLAGTAGDLALAFTILRGKAPGGAQTAVEAGALRAAVLGGYFETHASPHALAAVELVAQAVDARHTVMLPGAAQARAAAALITASEGAQTHKNSLRARPDDFDPRTRDRFLAGALGPAHWVEQARRVQCAWTMQVMDALQDFDILICATTPLPAPPLEAGTVTLNGIEVTAGASCGLLTQPLSLAGVPVVSAPVWFKGMLPIGVQIVGRPGREMDCLRVASFLEGVWSKHGTEHP
jgi:AtzE family amidohydrolase